MIVFTIPLSMCTMQCTHKRPLRTHACSHSTTACLSAVCICVTLVTRIHFVWLKCVYIILICRKVIQSYASYGFCVYLNSHRTNVYFFFFIIIIIVRRLGVLFRVYVQFSIGGRGLSVLFIRMHAQLVPITSIVNIFLSVLFFSCIR